MSIAFVLGGLVVAGVFAFVYIQNKKKKEQSNNANNGSSGNIPVSTPVVYAPVVYTEDDNSSSGTGGYTTDHAQIATEQVDGNAPVVTEKENNIAPEDRQNTQQH
jgi:hypothetical protein